MCTAKGILGKMHHTPPILALAAYLLLLIGSGLHFLGYQLLLSACSVSFFGINSGIVPIVFPCKYATVTLVLLHWHCLTGTVILPHVHTIVCTHTAMSAPSPTLLKTITSCAWVRYDTCTLIILSCRYCHTD